MYGYRQHEEDWGLHPPYHNPYVYPRYPRYPVYRRYDRPGWYPPGLVEMYGNRYYYDEFRSNSAHAPLPPPTDYTWNRPTRRTKSSAHARPLQFQAGSQFHPRGRIEHIPVQPQSSGFAERFLSDSPRIVGRRKGEGSRQSSKIIIEPDIHDKHSLHSQIIVNRTSQRNSRESLTSFISSRSIERISPTHRIQDKERICPEDAVLSQDRDSPNHRVFSWDKNSQHHRSYKKDRVSSKHRLSPNRLIYSRESSEKEQEETYRVISELVPSTTSRIHEAILDTGRPEVVLDVHKLEHGVQGNTCTCWQCTGSRKSSKSSLIQDENSNIIQPGSIQPGGLSSRSTHAARRHLQKSGTSARLLTQAELVKLTQFRRFLRSSNLSQLDFLLRVEQLRRSRDQEAGQEIDEEGKAYQNARLSRDETDQEFVTLAALLLCGELEIRADTFQAITTKLKVREKLYGLVSAETDGIVTGDQLIERVATARRSAPKSELAGDNLRWLEKVFKRTVGDHGEITLSDFKNIVQSKNPFFVERVFQIFDKDESGSISFQEFLDAMHQFAGQTPDDKIKFLFKVYDIDGDGLVQEAELQHVMRACMDENGMNFDEDSVEELTGALYQDATSSNQNGITFSALKSQISKHEGLLENLTISIDRWLVPPKPKKRQILTNLFNLSRNRHHQFSFTYVRNNAPLFAFYIIFFLVNLGLIISRLVGYRHTKNLDGSRNWALMVARAAGQCLNFCCTFVLVPMLRLSVTKLREKGLNYLLPLDKHVSFHALTGKLIGVYSLIHTVAHLVNLGMNILVDPVGFLLINRVPIPEHWSSNISLSSPPVIALLPPPFLTPGVNLSSSGNLANPNIIDFDHQFFSIPENWTVWSWLLTSTPGIFGLLPGLANPTGVALVIILSIMIICSMKWVRKSGNFEIFYWTHFLYLVFWLLVILHAPNFWKWFIGPCCLFIIEKCLRFYNSLSEKGKSYVTTGVVLPSKVVNLVIKRPPNFSFKPGDYIFLNIPSIAYFEWHPFTISSAPEQADTISLHIRAVGHWTNSLYQHFEKEQARQDGLESPRTRRTRLRETLQTARERARKISSGISGTSTYNLHSRPGAGAWQGGVAGRGRSRTTMSNLYNNNHMKRRETVLQMSGIGGGEMREDEVSTDIKMVARSYRYMRRKPTILSYQPPKESIDERGEDDLCSSNHFILDRIAEKESTDNLYRSGDDSDIDIKNVNKPLHVYIDGPFGAPTSQIFHAQHAVLIGTGIGVTPFASILKSIMHRYWAARNSCPKCSYSWTNDLRSSVMNLRKVDFFWINREQRSFEWFVNLLSQLEIEQAEQGGAMERFLDMHMYITSALQKTDMKAVGLQLALELLHEKSKRDLITGLKTRTIAGRPNWDKVFKQVTETRKGRVTVFFCGPPQLGKVLKLKCDQFGFDYRKENF